MNRMRIILFIAVAAVQLSVPIYLIANREYVIRNGSVYNFRTEPVDPYDAFRGRYVSLSYDFEDKLNLALEKKYLPSRNARETEIKKVYVTLKRDREGFADVADVSETAPDIPDYLAFKIRIDEDSVSFTTNFDKFYMDEFDAPEADYVYREESRKKNAYAVVHVRKGQAVLCDVMIEKTPIREYLEKHRDDRNKEKR